MGGDRQGGEPEGGLKFMRVIPAEPGLEPGESRDPWTAGQ